MHKFKAQPDWYDIEQLDDARDVSAIDAKDAAEKYVELNFANLDYPKSVEVIVRDKTGFVTKWDVDVEAVPMFTARESRKVSR